jgi:hypothetical protein
VPNSARAAMAGALACALSAACAPPPAPTSAPPAPAVELALADRAAFADLLRIEDARLYDAALLGSLAAS